MPKTKVISATCPDCLVQIRFHKMPQIDELVSCPECEAALEVVSLQPLKLEWVFDDVEDDDDDYDDYDEEDSDW